MGRLLRIRYFNLCRQLMVNVAQMLEYGDGIKRDKATAVYWYQKLLANGVKHLGKDKEGNAITIQSKIDKLTSDKSSASPVLKLKH